MAMQLGTGKGPISDINVTPLVDVMLVLLIIFMIVTPTLKENVDVDLPQGKGVQAEAPSEDPMDSITIDKFRIVHAGGQTVKMDDATMELPRLYKGREKRVITMKAHKDVSHGDIVRVLSALRTGGVETIHFECEPISE